MNFSGFCNLISQTNLLDKKYLKCCHQFWGSQLLNPKTIVTPRAEQGKAREHSFLKQQGLHIPRHCEAKE
jgi:hypothetical protein